jgi:hypothetical protein
MNLLQMNRHALRKHAFRPAKCKQKVTFINNTPIKWKRGTNHCHQVCFMLPLTLPTEKLSSAPAAQDLLSMWRVLRVVQRSPIVPAINTLLAHL